MVYITLPDGSQRQYPGPVTVAEVAQSIGPALARVALCGKVKVDGCAPKLVDTHFSINGDADLTIITAKDTEGIDLIRHSTAHLLAHAVKSIFPEAQITIGPVIDSGFYYDFAYKRPFTSEDLTAIERKMAELAKCDKPIIREEWSRNEAIDFFKLIGETYKAEIIASIHSSETLSLYRQDHFVDLCRGPHVPSTGKLKVFKLTKVSGAYWRGDNSREMLQRIYGTAWSTKEEQDAYLHMLEEAEKRDHRKIGRDLNLFHFQEEGPGLIFWHPKGCTIWQQVEQYMRTIYRENGYQEVKAPQILDISLWKKTGHWENYHENMFTTDSENRTYGLKPMNCPGHVQIYNAALHSYRDLPLRYGEFGQCYRNELSGSLHGLMRVRGFTQDDGHIFCTEEQLQGECVAFTKLLQSVYKDFGFSEVLYKVATRPQKRIGSDETWDKAESALIESLHRAECKFEISLGEGAFYGPKIEYTLKDAIGRHWQCGTIQVDFSMPERLGAEYVDCNDQRQVPVMLHRAILGSLERFIGMLIENYAGAMPPWLAPLQAVVCCISENSANYAAQITQDLQKQGFRVQADLRGEKITRKIREHSLQKVPYILVVGDYENKEKKVSVRGLNGLDLGVIDLNMFEIRLLEEITERRPVNISMPEVAVI